MPKHSKSNIYSNHSKTSTDIPSGYEYVAEQIKDAKYHVKRLNMYTDIMSGKGEGDLSNMSKATQKMWHSLGQRTRGYIWGTDEESDQKYDKTVRAGIAAEYTGLGTKFSTMLGSYGYRVNQEAQKKKKKRIL